jgi:hypothetical protein
LPLSSVLANSRGQLAEKPGGREHPNLLARHLSTGPSRSPRNPHHARRIDCSVAALPRPARSSRQRAARPVPPSRAQTDLGTRCTTRSAALSRRRLGQSSAAVSADYATGRREPIYLLAGGAEEPKGCELRQHGIPAGRQRPCLPLLSVRCSLRLRLNAAGHTNKAARMPGPFPQGPNGIEGASFPWALPSFWWIGRTPSSSRTYPRIALYH